MIAATMNNTASETDEGEDGNEEYKDEEGSDGYESSPGNNRSNPFEWEEEDEVEENWQAMWENSLRVLSKVESSSPEAKLEEIEKLSASPPRRLFDGRRGGKGKESKKKSTTRR